MKEIFNSLPPKSGKTKDKYMREIDDLLLEVHTLEDRLNAVETNRNELWCQNVDLKSVLDLVKELQEYWQKGGTYIIPVEVMNNLYSTIEEVEERYATK